MTLLRRHSKTIAYIFLALAVAVSIGYTRTALSHQTQHNKIVLLHRSAENRQELAKAVRQVLRDGCRKGNDLRYVIRGLIAQSIPNVKHQVAVGRLTPQEGRSELALIHKDIRLVPIQHCAKNASPIR